jgi:hypothetical protein
MRGVLMNRSKRPPQNVAATMARMNDDGIFDHRQENGEPKNRRCIGETGVLERLARMG